jgi:hypothetical protein
MRLWSIHPKYLDRQGLLALWREGLLAQAVLLGHTKGYRNHPQLLRFRNLADPVECIGAYLSAVLIEAAGRGYSFDSLKVQRSNGHQPIFVNRGQIDFEWQHLLLKLSSRDPIRYSQFQGVSSPDCHPLFQIRPGGLEPWERGSTKA